MSKGGNDSDAETEGTSATATSTENGGGEAAATDAVVVVVDDAPQPDAALEAEDDCMSPNDDTAAAANMTTDAAAPAPDVYGQVHPVETPDLITDSLLQLANEIQSISEEDRAGWEEAMERCPDLVGIDHMLLFLRCEVFHADRAALRLTKYWSKRIELFGDHRAFLPLTLDGALKDDLDSLIFGFVRTNDRMTDDEGRRVLFMDPALLENGSYDRESMNRATWYVIHAALEDESTQRKGVVMIVYPPNARLGQFDRKLIRDDVDSIRGCIPIRVGAFHVCHPPLFAHIVLPVIKLIIGRRLGSRLHVIVGKKEAVLDKLDGFGLCKKSVPSELGGYLVLDQDLWLADRRVAGG